MISRFAMVIGVGAVLAGPALAQGQPARNGIAPPPATPGAAPSGALPSGGVLPSGAPRSGAPTAGVPRTLAEALAATYSNQPALQAERAKLRATDENLPTALAGWRPTVVLAGTTGYGDGLARS
jgi:outer membrane protein